MAVTPTEPSDCAIGGPASDPTCCDYISMATAVIPRAAETIWPHLLNQAQWMREFTVETIAGVPGRVGELKRISAVTGEPQFPAFCFQTILLLPCRKFAYKAFSESKGGDFYFAGVEILSLSKQDKKTTVVTFEAYLEVQSSTMSKAELDAFLAGTKREGEAMWERNFSRLAALATG